MHWYYWTLNPLEASRCPQVHLHSTGLGSIKHLYTVKRRYLCGRRESRKGFSIQSYFCAKERRSSCGVWPKTPAVPFGSLLIIIIGAISWKPPMLTLLKIRRLKQLQHAVGHCGASFAARLRVLVWASPKHSPNQSRAQTVRHHGAQLLDKEKILKYFFFI